MKRTLIGLVAAALVVAGCTGAPPKPAEAPASQPAASEVAPTQPTNAPTQPTNAPIAREITAKDVNTGEIVRLSELKGQIVLLNFWATWCGPCRQEMPHLDQLQKEMAGKVRVIALGADPREKPETLAAYAKDRQLSLTVAHDGGAASQVYQAYGLPASVFIDKNGFIRQRVTGAMTLEQMKMFISQVEQASNP
ncbi:MAG TPA: TlpA disulfide reductase family protein [Symbiobacteriaceae bacterium]|jgi:thiol-disulfide isomerase/thioredoxin|nr:TlpA disulfide reductase family protein [Symbiobacteriaceae bacterium]